MISMSQNRTLGIVQQVATDLTPKGTLTLSSPEIHKSATVPGDGILTQSWDRPVSSMYCKYAENI